MKTETNKRIKENKKKKSTPPRPTIDWDGSFDQIKCGIYNEKKGEIEWDGR